MNKWLFVLMLIATPCAAQEDPWFSTFSIIAFDPATNELGVGVQSRAFAAGAAVPFAKPGVGAVATQASANRCMDRRRSHCSSRASARTRSSSGSLTRIPGRDTRQVAVIDTKGRSAVYTGKHVIDRNFDAKDPVHYGGYAGHVTGQKLLRCRATRWRARRSSRRWPTPTSTARESMADRLMDALDAGQSKGGDMRGMQSAGILVVQPVPAELRVDRRAHRRHPRRRCDQSVRGAAAAAANHGGRAGEADRASPRSWRRTASSRTRSRNRRRRSRSRPTTSSCTTPWRSATRRPANTRTRCGRSKKRFAGSPGSASKRGRRSRVREDARARRVQAARDALTLSS